MARHSKIACLYMKTLQSRVFAWIEATFFADVGGRHTSAGPKRVLNQWVGAFPVDLKKFQKCRSLHQCDQEISKLIAPKALKINDNIQSKNERK